MQVRTVQKIDFILPPIPQYFVIHSPSSVQNFNYTNPSELSDNKDLKMATYKTFLAIFLTFTCFSCGQNSTNMPMLYSIEQQPGSKPLEFKQALKPTDKIIHKGIFSADLTEYYYTISDQDFSQFDVFVIKMKDGTWTAPEKAFFNSEYNEHGMSFTPYDNAIYFSSTRPVNVDRIPQTWHIWKSEKIDNHWSKPIFVDIPNLNDKLVSHPSISKAGNLYFHASNLDYSNMQLYKAKVSQNRLENVERVTFANDFTTPTCTPFISPEEDYLLFTSIGKQLDLMISFKGNDGIWGPPIKLNDQINKNGQGNPFVTPDNKFLFFATGDQNEKTSSVKWVAFENILEKLRVTN